MADGVRALLWALRDDGDRPLSAERCRAGCRRPGPAAPGDLAGASRWRSAHTGLWLMILAELQVVSVSHSSSLLLRNYRFFHDYAGPGRSEA